jgi:hypothetical protein
MALPKFFYYPKAHENRVSIHEPAVRIARRTLLKAALTNFLLLQILFLALFAYIFGSLFKQGAHTHNMKVLYVDYDNGLVGTTIRNAYHNLQSDEFPSLIERSPSDFATPDDLRREVCDTRYWAALYTAPGASNRLETALSDGSTAYDKADIVKYIWNEARYSAVIDSTIAANLQTLSSAARVGYASSNWTSIPNPSGATFSNFADPWHLSSVNIQPTSQGARLIYNTLVIILILIQEFFYLGTINSLYEAFHIYSRLNPHRIIAFRFVLSAAYTLIGSLCVAGAIWAFRAGWHVNGKQFALTWAILWLFAHVNFLTLDVFSVWVPGPFVPMALITWVVFNVTSILLPFELSPPFYRWAYVMPAHEVYQILVDIWSGGCNPKLDYALPVLFALEVSGFVLGALGVHRRAHYATLKDQSEKETFQMRVDTAVQVAKRKECAVCKARAAATATSRTSSEINAADAVDEKEKGEEHEHEHEHEDDVAREDIADVLRKEDDEIKKVLSRGPRPVQFGPSFGLPFGTSGQ